MAIRSDSLFKGEVIKPNLSEWVDIYQVPAGKKVILKEFLWYVTLNSVIGGGNGAIAITTSADVVLLYIRLTNNVQTSPTWQVSATDESFKYDSEIINNMVLEDQQKIRLGTPGTPNSNALRIRISLSGAVEDV